MKTRAITSVVILVLALLLLVVSHYIVYPIVLSVVALVAVYEILKVMQAHRKIALVIPAYLLALAFPTAAFFVTKQSLVNFLLILAGALFVYLLWLMGVSVFSKGKTSVSTIAEAFIATVYVTVSCTSLSLVRYLDRETGAFTVVLIFMVAWICDVFAFLVGSLIGKHKLIPEVSPKKTVEGAIGGVVFTAAVCLLYGFALDMIFENLTVNYLMLGLSGSILSVVSQLGDLIASLIKREYGVKDYGKIFPGHGGIMDRFDSVLAVSTILLMLCMAFPPFVFT